MTDGEKSVFSVPRLVLSAGIALTLLLALLPAAPDLPALPPGPLQHAVAFVVLTVLSKVSFPQARGTTMFLALAILGGLIEFVQSLPQISREASIEDWLIDCGAVVGSLAVLCMVRRFRKPATSAD